MKMSAHKLLLLVTLQLSVCLLTTAQSPNKTTSATVTTTQDPDPINQALGPLYDMTNAFIHAVFPNGIRIDTIQSTLELLTPGAVIDAWALTSTLLNGYAGFATCVVVGLLLVILMPFIGCFCCCCRACNKCGGKTHQSDPSNAKCKRILCAGLLLIFTLCTVAGMVMIFFSSSRLYTIIEDGTIDQELQQSLMQLNDSVYTTVEQDIVEKADVIIEDLGASVNTHLDAAGSTLAGALLSNLTHVEQPIDDLARELDGVNKTLDLLLDSMKTFEDIRDGTEANFTQAHALIQNTTLAGIPDLVNGLDTLSNVTASLSLNGTINALETGVKAQLNNIPNLRDAYKEVNSTVANVIEDNFNRSKTDIQNTVSDATQQASNEVRDLTSGVTGALDDVMSSAQDASDVLTLVAEYAAYIWYACIALGSIVALIALLYMCGLMFGCGERPGPDANFCNKGCGAKCLLAAVGFTFIFYSLLMLLTTVLFSVGSLSTSHICWTIQEPAQTAEHLSTSDFTIPNSEITIHSIVKAYSDCLEQEPIGNIVEDLNLGFGKENLTKMVEDQLKVVNIDQVIDSINIDTSGINILPSNLNQSLDDLKSFNDFNSSIIPNMTEHVETIKNSINTVLTAVNVTLAIVSDPVDVAALSELQGILLYSRDVGLDMMAIAAEDVRADIIVIEDSQDNLLNASENAIKAITKAEETIVQNGTDLVKTILKDQVAGLTDAITADVSTGIDDLFSAQCDDIAESLKSTANVVCVTVLDPLNALWYSLGWALIMLIPCLIIALFTASLFRREQSYDGSDYKEDFSQYVSHTKEYPSRVKVFPAPPIRNRPYDRDDIPLESRGGPNHHYLPQSPLSPLSDNTNRAFRDDYGRHMYNGGGGYRHNKPPGSRMGY